MALSRGRRSCPHWWLCRWTCTCPWAVGFLKPPSAVPGGRSRVCCWRLRRAGWTTRDSARRKPPSADTPTIDTQLQQWSSTSRLSVVIDLTKPGTIDNRKPVLRNSVDAYLRKNKRDLLVTARREAWPNQTTGSEELNAPRRCCTYSLSVSMTTAPGSARWLVDSRASRLDTELQPGRRTRLWDRPILIKSSTKLCLDHRIVHNLAKPSSLDKLPSK